MPAATGDRGAMGIDLADRGDEFVVTATSKNGVLTVRLPKAGPSGPSRHIEVE